MRACVCLRVSVCVYVFVTYSWCNHLKTESGGPVCVYLVLPQAIGHL